MDILVRTVATDDSPTVDLPYTKVKYDKIDNFSHPETDEIIDGTTLVIWEDENANREIDPGDLRAFFPSGTWVDVIEI